MMCMPRTPLHTMAQSVATASCATSSATRCKRGLEARTAPKVRTQGHATLTHTPCMGTEWHAHPAENGHCNGPRTSSEWYFGLQLTLWHSLVDYSVH